MNVMRKIGLYSLFLILAGFTYHSLATEAGCNYCEGFEVLERAVKTYPPPTENEVPSARHGKIVDLAEKIIDRIFLETTELQGRPLKYFVRTLAFAAPYDAGHVIVANYWDKISAHRHRFNGELNRQKQAGEVSAAQFDRLKLAIAVHEGMIREGQDPNNVN